MVTTILLLFVLLFISYQDFRIKAISWWTCPLLVALLFLYSYHTLPIASILINFAYNVLFICFLICSLFLFYSLKNKKNTRIINNKIGAGDILFFFAIAVVFSPVLFIVFITGSSLISLLGYFIFYFFKSHKNIQIPLAGIFSLILIPMILIEKFVLSNVSLFNNTFLENMILQSYGG